jgi:hypothetical protein
MAQSCKLLIWQEVTCQIFHLSEYYDNDYRYRRGEEATQIN